MKRFIRITTNIIKKALDTEELVNHPYNQLLSLSNTLLKKLQSGIGKHDETINTILNFVENNPDLNKDNWLRPELENIKEYTPEQNTNYEQLENMPHPAESLIQDLINTLNKKLGQIEHQIRIV